MIPNHILNELKADIAANGVINPIWLYQGRVLDGRNRLRACEELGIEPRVEEFRGDADQAAAFVESQNERRRHLNDDQRRRLADERAGRVKHKKHVEGKSIRVIAEEEGVSKSQVEKDLKKSGVHPWTPDAESETEPDEPIVSQPEPSPPPASPKVTGKDGKQYPASQPKAAPAGLRIMN